MIQALLTKETPEIIRFFRNIDSLSEMLDKQEEKLRPVLNGERYITDRELAEQLKLTRRTLAEYRINGKLPYYKIGGKLLYKEKDILALLERNRVEAFDDRFQVRRSSLDQLGHGWSRTVCQYLFRDYIDRAG